MQHGPPPPQTDELRGLAWLVLFGAVGLLGLLLADWLSGGPGALVARVGGEQQARVGELGPRGQGSGPSGPGQAGLSPTPGVGLGTYATGVAHEDDPQMVAFHQSYQGAVDAGVPQPFSIAYHRGTLVSASGAAGVRPGARCEVRVLPVSSYAFNCLLRVTCDDVVIYPDDALRAGYAPCEIEGSEAVSAVDDSSSDGDREIDLDVRGRSVVVQEHAPGGGSVLAARVQLES